MHQYQMIAIGVCIWFFLLSPMANCETVVVQIIKSSFVPAVVKIKKGDTVRWVNTEELLHTVTSGKAPIHDEKFNAPFLVGKFETTIDKVGVVDYFCAIHNVTMRGVILVEEKK